MISQFVDFNYITIIACDQQIFELKMYKNDDIIGLNFHPGVITLSLCAI